MSSRKSEDAKTHKLILEVEKKTCIYDKSLTEYKDTQKKDDIWKQIASRLDISGEY
jgi:hypothetical protein